MWTHRLIHAINILYSSVKLDNSLCTSLITILTCILMINIHKNVIRYFFLNWTNIECKQICKQPGFLANGADLIDKGETWLTK